MNRGRKSGDEDRISGLAMLLSGEENPDERYLESRLITSCDDIRFLSAESLLEHIFDLPSKTLILPDGPLDVDLVRKIIKDKIRRENSIDKFREIVLDSSGSFGELKSLLHPLRVRSMGSLVSARANCSVSRGKWMYEVELETAGLQQIGWATSQSVFSDTKGVGNGEDSYAFDGMWGTKWNGEMNSYGQQWTVGDVIGCCIDLEECEISFYMNGESLGTAFSGIQRGSENAIEFYPAITLAGGEACNLNFGGRPFKYPVEDFLPLQRPPLQLSSANRLLRHLSQLLDLHNSERLRRSKRYFLISSLFHPISRGICAEYLEEIEAEGVLEHIAESSFFPFLMEQFAPRPPHNQGNLERAMDLFLEFPSSRSLCLRLIMALAARCRTGKLVLLDCPFSGSYPFLSLAAQILRRKELVSLWWNSPEFGSSLEGFLSVKPPNEHDLRQMLPSFMKEDHFDSSMVLVVSAISGNFDKIEELHRELCRIVIEFIPPSNPDATLGSVFMMFLRNMIESARSEEINYKSPIVSLFTVILHFLSEGSTPTSISEGPGGFLHRAGRRSFPLWLLQDFDPVRTKIMRLGGLYSQLNVFLEREEVVWEEGCLEENETKVTHSGLQKPCCCCISQSDLGWMNIAMNPIDYQQSEEPAVECTHTSEVSSILNHEMAEKPVDDIEIGSLPRYQAFQKVNKFPYRNPLSRALGEEELLDAVLFLFKFGVWDYHYVVFFCKSDHAMWGAMLENVERQMRGAVSSETHMALKEARNGYKEQVLSITRRLAWYRAYLSSLWKQRGTYALCVWVAEMLLVFSRDDELFPLVPEFYLEALVACVLSLSSSDPLFVSLSIFFKQGLSPFVTLIAMHFNDRRIVSVDLRDMLLQSITVLITQKEFVAALESNKPALEKMPRALLTSFDQRSWIHVSNVLNHICCGLGFGLSTHRAQTTSSLFQTSLRDTCLADQHLLSSFLDKLFNALCMTMMELTSCIRGADDGSQMLDPEGRDCYSLIHQTCELMRILEFFTLSTPQCFLQESKVNLRRVREMIVFLLNHLVSGPVSELIDFCLKEMGQYTDMKNKDMMLGPIVGIISNLVEALDGESNDFVGMFASTQSPAIQSGLQHLLEYNWENDVCQERMVLLERFVLSLTSKQRKLNSDVEDESEQCYICREAKEDAVFKPCMHRSCFGCITRHLLNRKCCFFCNAVIEEVSKIE